LKFLKIPQDSYKFPETPKGSQKAFRRLPEATEKLQGSPKKAQGQDLALAPVKPTFFSIDISSVLVP
jgi:hypothetical protein